MAVLRNSSKCSHTTCMLRFFTVSCLALNPNLNFEIGSNMSLKFGEIPFRTELYPAFPVGPYHFVQLNMEPDVQVVLKYPTCKIGG